LPLAIGCLRAWIKNKKIGHHGSGDRFFWLKSWAAFFVVPARKGRCVKYFEIIGK